MSLMILSQKLSAISMKNKRTGKSENKLKTFFDLIVFII